MNLRTGEIKNVTNPSRVARAVQDSVTAMEMEK